MSESGFASLGPTLLARKGGAKPAMRPQVAPLVQDEAELAALADEQLEDLGWNDMGDHEGGANIVPINADLSADQIAHGHGPVVHRQQKRLEERVLADAAMTGPDDREPEYDAEDEDDYGEEIAGQDIYAPSVAEPVVAQPVVRTAAKPRSSAAASGRRAAFTLRLDTDRHLKLRLAATMQGVSAQILVTEALDRLLAEFDELDVIASHLKRH
jgi:hypothetical protein